MHIGLFEVGLASCCFFAERAGSGHLKIDKGASGDPMVLDGPSQLVTPAASVIPRGPSDWIIVGEKVEPWEAFLPSRPIPTKLSCLRRQFSMKPV